MVIDGISLNLQTIDGFLRAPFRLEEVVYLEVPEDSVEAECLRSGLANKVGKRVILMMTGDSQNPLRIAEKTDRTDAQGDR